MSEQFVTADDGSKVNLRHVVQVFRDGMATLADGTRAKLHMGDNGPDDVVRPVVTAPAAHGTTAIVFLRGGGTVEAPVIAWRIVGGVALPIIPDTGRVMAVGIKYGGRVLLRGRWFSPADDLTGLAGFLHRADAELADRMKGASE